MQYDWEEEEDGDKDVVEDVIEDVNDRATFIDISEDKILIYILEKSC